MESPSFALRYELSYQRGGVGVEPSVKPPHILYKRPHDNGVPCVPAPECNVPEDPEILEWKMLMQAHGDMNQDTNRKICDEIVCEAVKYNPDGDSQCPTADYAMSPIKCSSFEDLDMRLEDWSLLDDIMQQFHESEEYRDIADFFSKEKQVTESQLSLQSQQSQRDNEINAFEFSRKNSETEFGSTLSRDSLTSSTLASVKEEEREEKKDREKALDQDFDCPRRNWSLLDDIVSHFSETDTRSDISKILLKDESDEKIYTEQTKFANMQGHWPKYINLLKPDNDRTKRRTEHTPGNGPFKVQPRRCIPGDGPFKVEPHRKLYTRWRKNFDWNRTSNWRITDDSDRETYLHIPEITQQLAAEQSVVEERAATSEDMVVDDVKKLNSKHADVDFLEKSFANIDVKNLTSGRTSPMSHSGIYHQVDSYISSLFQKEERKESSPKIKITYCN
ncbi:uncharacterized protein LOC121386399 isoform X2 [Gigantopelta aegis]|uniref:uncharacterized protein LOC121386399 isoform X2 n=1 Tax=Gigantopelta aegis TaxID=1735272 RepID=UPI001B88B558|nr:uncharacterized protein LOC121386399 isoform X2 [Gigantopelta aegis]